MPVATAFAFCSGGVSPPTRHLTIFATLIITLAALTGCDRDDQIQSYRSPKEPPKPVAPLVSAPPTSPQSADSGIASWSAPPDWKLDPSPRLMRLMTFIIPSEKGPAEVFITEKMPKGTFELSANINRWRGQVMLPSTNDPSIHGPKKITVAGESADLFDFLGTNSKTSKPQRLLVVLQTRGEYNWFFRIMGPPDLVTQQQSAFEAFLNSIKFAG